MLCKGLSVFLLHFLFTTAYGGIDKDTIQIKQWILQSIILQRSDQVKSWQYAKRALELSAKNHYNKGIADANIRIGSLLYTNGNLDSSKQVINHSLALYLKLKNNKGAANSYLLLSYINNELGLTDSSFASIYRALGLYQKTSDSLGLIQSYVQLGNLFLEYNNTKAALKNFYQACQISERLKESEGLLSSWDGIGRSFLKTKQFDKSLLYFIKLDSIYQKTNDIYSQAQNLTNIALCYELMKEYNLSKVYYKKALNACIKLNMKTGMALGYYNIGSNYLLLKQPDSAIYAFNQSLVLSRQTNDPLRISKNYNLLAEAFAQKADFGKAYNYHLLYTSLSDSILNLEKVKQIAEMETRYETAKKQQQIALLDSQNKRQQAQRNFFIIASLLFLLFALSVLVGLIKTKKEKKISESLLLNILPEEIAKELKQKGRADAQFYDEVTVLFTDFKDFTQIVEKMDPSDLVDILHTCFKAFDHIITKHHVEKIKTIGDSYMCAGGLPVPNKSNAVDVVRAALEIQQYMRELMDRRIKEGKVPIEMRLGIHTGPVVAGIVGVKKFSYDIWGDTVNTASRMEQTSNPGEVNVSETTFALIKDKFICKPRGKIEAKHKGLIEMYFVEKEN